jgi:hypothetical protein
MEATLSVGLPTSSPSRAEKHGKTSTTAAKTAKCSSKTRYSTAPTTPFAQNTSLALLTLPNMLRCGK